MPKIHKDPNDPPLRPIISMSGTITHDVSKYLNNIIWPFIDQRYMLKSSHELLAHLKTLRLAPGNHLVSLDVESLFTNVPVNETIDIMLLLLVASVRPPRSSPSPSRRRRRGLGRGRGKGWKIEEGKGRKKGGRQAWPNPEVPWC